jgi:hypothetical protein
MKYLFFILSLILPGAAFSGAGDGKVTLLMPGNGVVIFKIESHINKPACSTQGDDWALSLATDAGRAQYALLLSAQAQGRSVWVTGANNCAAWGDREAPSWVFVQS